MFGFWKKPEVPPPEVAELLEVEIKREHQEELRALWDAFNKDDGGELERFRFWSKVEDLYPQLLGRKMKILWEGNTASIAEVE